MTKQNVKSIIFTVLLVTMCCLLKWFEGWMQTKPFAIIACLSAPFFVFLVYQVIFNSGWFDLFWEGADNVNGNGFNTTEREDCAFFAEDNDMGAINNYCRLNPLDYDFKCDKCQNYVSRYDGMYMVLKSFNRRNDNARTDNSSCEKKTNAGRAEELRRSLSELHGRINPKFETKCWDALNLIESGNMRDAFCILIEMLIGGEYNSDEMC